MIDRLYAAALWLLAPLAILGVLLHVLWGLAVALLLFPLAPSSVRDGLVAFWSRVLLAAVGVRLDLRLPPNACIEGSDEELGSLLLINHTSWLDIFAVAAVVPARFVSKSEVARWPLFGWLAVGVGTLFVERGRRHAVAAINHAVAHRLGEGQTIGIFPEGTTTLGHTLMSFHANLVQPALDMGARVRPVAVRYTQHGQPSEAAAFVGEMNIFQSLWRILCAPRLTVELHWLAPLPPGERNRHAAARACRAAIAQALQLPLEPAPAPATVVQEPMRGDEGGESEEDLAPALALSQASGNPGTAPER